MSGTMSSRMSPERSRLACGVYGSTRDSGKMRKRTEPTRRSAGMPNSRVSWSGGDEGDGRGPSDPGTDQVPRSRRPILRLPFHDSISVCTAPLTTRTTIEFGDGPRDQATIDGRDVTARDMERIRSVVDAIRAKASLRTPFRMASVNAFPSDTGLGASASGFAALALAAANAAG